MVVGEWCKAGRDVFIHSVTERVVTRHTDPDAMRLSDNLSFHGE